MRNLTQSSCWLPAMVIAALLAIVCPAPASAGQPSFVEWDFSFPDPWRTEMYGFPVWFEAQGTTIQHERGNDSWFTYCDFTITYTNLDNGKSVDIHFFGRVLLSNEFDDDGFLLQHFQSRSGAFLVVAPNEDVLLLAGRNTLTLIWDPLTGALVSSVVTFAGIDENPLDEHERLRALLAD